jgi:hypothetical protein
MDVVTLTGLLREAETRHGAYEPVAPKHHWSDWYAAYIVARDRGRSPEDAVQDAGAHMERILRS